MENLMSQPVLSLCIPIYNRQDFLDKMLVRFLEDQDLFETKISLYISDNCSQDDLGACCQKYLQKGLRMEYHRNEVNIGPDSNFEQCFRHATGKYVWLLGSDDIPVRGFLRRLIGYLESADDYGLVHLGMQKKDKEFTCYETSDDMAVAVNYWITFMSANIIRTASLKSIDLSDYHHSNMIQVPAYLNACCSCQKNAVVYLPQFFEEGSDAANNGGYNIYQVFVTNLYGIFETFVRKGLLSKQAFNKIIRIEFQQFLSGFIVDQLILRKKSNFNTDGGWKKLCMYYAFKPYAYYHLFMTTIRRGIISILRPVLKRLHDIFW